MGAALDPPLWTVVPNKALSHTHTQFSIYDLFIHGNVGIHKTQRRIYGDARRACRRSSSRFPLLTPTRVSFLSAVARVSNRGRLAEIFG